MHCCIVVPLCHFIAAGVLLACLGVISWAVRRDRISRGVQILAGGVVMLLLTSLVVMLAAPKPATLAPPPAGWYR